MNVLNILKDLSRYHGATPVSFSRVTSMLNCPRKWKLQYVDRLRPAPYADQESTDVGKFTHEVSELHMLRAKHSGMYEFSEQAFDSAWDCSASKYSSAVVARATRDMKAGAMHIAEGLFKLINDYGFKPFTEVRLGMNKQGNIVQGIQWRDALWVGIMDLHMVSARTRGTLITDYKSHAQKQAFTEKEKLQIDSYALLEYLREPSLNLVQNNISYFSTGTTDIVGKYKKEDVDSIATRFTIFLQQYFDRVQAAEFPPEKGDHCVWCGYTQNCPLQ